MSHAGMCMERDHVRLACWICMDFPWPLKLFGFVAQSSLNFLLLAHLTCGNESESLWREQAEDGPTWEGSTAK